VLEIKKMKLSVKVIKIQDEDTGTKSQEILKVNNS